VAGEPGDGARHMIPIAKPVMGEAEADAARRAPRVLWELPFHRDTSLRKVLRDSLSLGL